jgi:hypothetical protein
MKDRVSIGFVWEIRGVAEERLGRPLTEEEVRNIEKPRSYLALEMILDYLRDADLTASQVERYLTDL